MFRLTNSNCISRRVLFYEEKKPLQSISAVGNYQIIMERLRHAEPRHCTKSVSNLRTVLKIKGSSGEMKNTTI